MLRLFVARTVSRCLALPIRIPNTYQHVGRRLADQLLQERADRCVVPDQWNNLDNAKAQLRVDRPRIWQQTGGKIDASFARTRHRLTLAASIST